MKIPKTDKIIKAELAKNAENNISKTMSFRLKDESYLHFETVKKRLDEKYKVDFSNTDVIEFALAFAYENFNGNSEEG